ncbi:DUF5776 domain-containing protein [Levilactobacillus lanxiensis]|uniref:DUF5776 domain-containing protein n=1 Tax=Levilactobacillus lanxiensis TaxID=2799568 RepID=A0ABW4D2X6_9LACO|nr:DUF5776 domain-containing protein [Levilactobacillus lanxiensis]
MKNKLIKHAIIGLGVMAVTLSLGMFVGNTTSAFADDSDTTTTANEDNQPVLFNLLFQPTNGDAIEITGSSMMFDINQSGIVKMNDFLKKSFDGRFIKGKSAYDELDIVFRYADKPSEKEQGISELKKIWDSEGLDDTAFDESASEEFNAACSMITNDHLQDMTVDFAKTRDEATKNKVVFSKLDIPDSDTGATYKAQNFYVYLKPKVISSPVVDRSSLTADSQASITVGQTVDADTFNAKATNSAGDSIPVTVDTSKADLKKPGTYSVILTAANGETKTVTLTVQPASSPVVPQKKAVYALKKIYLYQKPTFNQHQRLATYVKTNRTKRPMFVVVGYARSNSGLLRYQVKDAAGKTGYITAKSAFIAPVYYQKSVKQIKVLNKKGINSYQDLKLTEAGKHVKMGATLKVIGLKHYHLTTRFELSNGQYVSANKKLVIAVK